MRCSGPWLMLRSWKRRLKPGLRTGKGWCGMNGKGRSMVVVGGCVVLGSFLGTAAITLVVALVSGGVPLALLPVCGCGGGVAGLMIGLWLDRWRIDRELVRKGWKWGGKRQMQVPIRWGDGVRLFGAEMGALDFEYAGRFGEVEELFETLAADWAREGRAVPDRDEVLSYYGETGGRACRMCGHRMAWHGGERSLGCIRAMTAAGNTNRQVAKVAKGDGEEEGTRRREGAKGEGVNQQGAGLVEAGR